MEDKKRAVNFTYDEKFKLVEFIKQHPVLLNKKTDGATNKAKDYAWEVLTTKFNSSGSIKRSVSSLKKMWNRMKSECKVYKAKLKINIAKTGGGTSDIKEDPLLDLIANLIGRAAVGIANVNDCDAIPDVNDSVIVQTVVSDMEDIEIEEMVVSDIDAIIEEESEATITPGPSNILNQTPQTPFHSRRRPNVIKCNKDILNELKLKTKEKKENFWMWKKIG
ncbi:uncharacterized protein [Diabrotica undecimpunctata]|uniref:uncharacterized protein n=1 Tax=Diabrotica undecimpunctata TaxID=50387 RepID=UPI003B63481A